MCMCLSVRQAQCIAKHGALHAPPSRSEITNCKQAVTHGEPVLAPFRSASLQILDFYLQLQPVVFAQSSPQTWTRRRPGTDVHVLSGLVVSRRGRAYYWGRNAFVQAGPWPAHVRAGQSYLADRPARHRLRAGPPQEQKCSDEHTAWPAQGLHGAGNRCSPIIPCHSSAHRLKSL